MICVVQSWRRKARCDAPLGVPCAVRRPAEGALRRRAAVYVLAAAAAVGCNSNPLGSIAGPDLTGTWSGSTTGLTLSVGLGKSTCEFGCSGFVTGGTYHDSVTGEHGTFTPGQGNYFLPYDIPNSGPLAGSSITINPVDLANTTAVITISGTFSSATAIAGYATIETTSVGGPSDSVSITLVKQ